jgi:hypothetical protein
MSSYITVACMHLNIGSLSTTLISNYRLIAKTT